MTATDNGLPLDVNVFNSSDIGGRQAKYDPDLGSPNEKCPGGGPGVGVGGEPGALFPNCVPQNNLLIIQNENNTEDEPNDRPLGGCFIIEFQQPVELINMGLLDMEEPRINITVSKFIVFYEAIKVLSFTILTLSNLFSFSSL